MKEVLTFKQWTGSIRLNENVQAAKRELIKRYVEQNKIEEITPEVEQKAIDTEAYTKIREIVKGNDGYVYAFLLFHLDHSASFSRLEQLYRIIKENAGSLNQLPMTIEEYAKQENIHGLNPIEALEDEFGKIINRRKYKWVVDSVNGKLRRAIKQSFDLNQLDRLYAAAKLIDDADEKDGLSPKDEKSNRSLLLLATNRYSNPTEYLMYVESSADGVSDTDIYEKIEAIRLIQPQAGIIYYGNKRLVMSVRTEDAQKQLCKNVSLWCINNTLWGSYAGKHPEALQINIYDFNYPPTNDMFTTGTTIDASGKVQSSSNKSNNLITKSSDPREHFSALGYPKDLVNTLMSKLPQERMIKSILSELKVDTMSPPDLLFSLVKSTYTIDLDIEKDILDVIISIITDQVAGNLSRESVIGLYMKVGVLSTFSARILNILIPDLTDSEKTDLLNATNNVFNEMRALLRQHGTRKFPTLPGKLKDAEKIKDIINSGESLKDTQD